MFEKSLDNMEKRMRTMLKRKLIHPIEVYCTATFIRNRDNDVLRNLNKTMGMFLSEEQYSKTADCMDKLANEFSDRQEAQEDELTVEPMSNVIQFPKRA